MRRSPPGWPRNTIRTAPARRPPTGPTARKPERLLLWATLEHGKAISSLTVEDVNAFKWFLAAPPARWCGPRHRQRWSAALAAARGAAQLGWFAPGDRHSPQPLHVPRQPELPDRQCFRGSGAAASARALARLEKDPHVRPVGRARGAARRDLARGHCPKASARHPPGSTPPACAWLKWRAFDAVTWSGSTTGDPTARRRPAGC